jgi:hypothetical protein
VQVTYFSATCTCRVLFCALHPPPGIAGSRLPASAIGGSGTGIFTACLTMQPWHLSCPACPGLLLGLRTRSYQVEGLPSHAAMVQEYQAIASALQPYVDVLLAETLSTTAEALAAAEATASMGEPAFWCTTAYGG